MYELAEKRTVELIRLLGDSIDNGIPVDSTIYGELLACSNIKALDSADTESLISLKVYCENIAAVMAGFLQKNDNTEMAISEDAKKAIKSAKALLKIALNGMQIESVWNPVPIAKSMKDDGKHVDRRPETEGGIPIPANSNDSTYKEFVGHYLSILKQYNRINASGKIVMGGISAGKSKVENAIREIELSLFQKPTDDQGDAVKDGLRGNAGGAPKGQEEGFEVVHGSFSLPKKRTRLPLFMGLFGLCFIILASLCATGIIPDFTTLGSLVNTLMFGATALFASGLAVILPITKRDGQRRQMFYASIWLLVIACAAFISLWLTGNVLDFTAAVPKVSTNVLGATSASLLVSGTTQLLGVVIPGVIAVIGILTIAGLAIHKYKQRRDAALYSTQYHWTQETHFGPSGLKQTKEQAQEKAISAIMELVDGQIPPEHVSKWDALDGQSKENTNEIARAALKKLQTLGETLSPEAKFAEVIGEEIGKALYDKPFGQGFGIRLESQGTGAGAIASSFFAWSPVSKQFSVESLSHAFEEGGLLSFNTMAHLSNLAAEPKTPERRDQHQILA